MHQHAGPLTVTRVDQEVKIVLLFPEADSADAFTERIDEVSIEVGADSPDGLHRLTVPELQDHVLESPKLYKVAGLQLVPFLLVPLVLEAADNEIGLKLLGGAVDLFGHRETLKAEIVGVMIYLYFPQQSVVVQVELVDAGLPGPFQFVL